MSFSLPDVCPAGLVVDLSALRSNYKALSAFVSSSCQIAGMVKADAYGLGAVEVVKALEDEECPFYFVATPDEGLTVRGVTRKPVAVLGGLFGAPDFFTSNELTPVINTLEDLALWRAEAQRQQKALPAVLHLETGLNRLALTKAEVETIVRDSSLSQGIDVIHIMGHMACADEPDHVMNAEQVNEFKALCSSLPKSSYGMAASAALMMLPDTHMDLARPGIALYGSAPLADSALVLQPVVAAYGRVLQVKSVQKQSSIGYNATYRFGGDARVATVALGYADGLFRSLSNKGALYINGQRCSIRGRVSMDYVSVEIGTLDVKPGDVATVIGAEQSVKDVAAQAGTIDYEVLTALGSRYQRFYKGA